MNIPKTIKVGGVTYTVDYVDHLLMDTTEVFGICDIRESTIHLLSSLRPQQMEITFIHELIHAILNHCDLDQDEHAVEILAQALYMVIEDNPGIFKD